MTRVQLRGVRRHDAVLAEVADDVDCAALAGHVPAARQVESWFYLPTQTGALLRHARDIISDTGAPRPAWFPLVPTGQPESS